MANTGALLRSFPCLEEIATPASQLPRQENSTRYASLELSCLKLLLINGLASGTITQIEGQRSSGRTALGAYILAQATQRGDICAVIDVQNHLSPEFLQAADVQLNQLLWIRCDGNSEHAMRATDLILHAGGFGIVWLDMCEVPMKLIQRIPLSYWYRFRRTIENTATTLLVSGDTACAKSSVSNHLELKTKAIDWLGSQGIVRLVKSSATLQKNAQTHPLVLQAQV